MIKPLKVSDKSVRRFVTHKNWNYNNITNLSNILLEQTSGGKNIDLFVDESVKLSTEQYDQSNLVKISKGKKYKENETFYPTNHRMHDSTTELINTDGTYQRIVFNSVKHLFYNDYGMSVLKNSVTKNPMMVFGTETGNFLEDDNNNSLNFLSTDDSVKFERRIIGDSVIVVQFDSRQFGEKIKPNNFKISDYSSPYGAIEIIDDGATNLMIDSVSFNDIKETSNPSMIDVSKSNNVFDFNNLTFGEHIVSNNDYFLTGQPVDHDAPTEINTGKASLFKLNKDNDSYDLIREFFNPFTQNGFSSEVHLDNTGFIKNELGGLLVSGDYSINDNFGDAIDLNNDFCVVGSSRSHIRGVCSETGTTGHIFVYGKNKGGNENWGLLNIIEGEPQTEFGTSVSLHGDYLAVGAPGHNKGEGAIYIFKKEKRTTSHFYKRASDVYDHYEYDEKTKRFTGLPKGDKLKKNNRWSSRYKISSMIPEEDSLNFFFKSESSENWSCTEPGFTSYIVSRTVSVQDQHRGIYSSYWIQSGVISVPPSDTNESSLPYPIDVYDASDTHLGHLTFNGKPKINRIYYKPSGSYYSCYVGEIENNVCRFKSEIVLSGYEEEDCVDSFSYKRYKIGNKNKIKDSDEGVVSSYWKYEGILSIPSVNLNGSKTPYSIDVYINEQIIGHITISGVFYDEKIYFKALDGICYEGIIDDNECHLYKQIKLEGKLISDKFNDYQISNEISIIDTEVGITSSVWGVDGILSLPYVNKKITSTPHSVDIILDSKLLGHITFTGLPMSNSIYFTNKYGERYVGTIVNNMCELQIINIKNKIEYKVPTDSCSDENPNTFYISAWNLVNDQESGIIVSSWSYEGYISLPMVDTSYGDGAKVVDIYDEQKILVGHVLFLGKPTSDKIFFKDRHDICYSGYITDNVCQLSSVEKERPQKDTDWCAEDAHEINTFDGDVVAMEDNIEGYPLHRYDEDEDGNYSPTYSVGDDTWELQEIIKIPNSDRLGENVKLKSSFLYTSSPSSQLQIVSIFKRLNEKNDCLSYFQHTHDINTEGIFKYKSEELAIGGGINSIDFIQEQTGVFIKVKIDDNFSNSRYGFSYRIDKPLNEKIEEDEYVISGGVYVDSDEVFIELKNGEFEIYIGRTTNDDQLVGVQSRLSIVQNPILHNEVVRDANSKYKFKYNKTSNNFGISFDANENYLVIGDSIDREYFDEYNSQKIYSNGSVYVFKQKDDDFLFFKKTYTDELTENKYSSEYGISVSLKDNNFAVGEPLLEQSEIYVLDDGETFASENYRYGANSQSDDYYSQLKYIITDGSFDLLGGNNADAIFKVSRKNIDVNENLKGEFTISHPYIDETKIKIDYTKIPLYYLHYSIKSETRIDDHESGIMSSTFSKDFEIYLPPSSTSNTSVPFSFDVFDNDRNFICHITYTGTPTDDVVYFKKVENNKIYKGEVQNEICFMQDEVISMGDVTRGIYRDKTIITDDEIIFYVDLLPNSIFSQKENYIDNIGLVYYELRDAHEGKVHYYNIEEDDIKKLKEIKVNKQKNNIRHQFGRSVSLSASNLYVGSPVTGDFNLNEIESFEGVEFGLFGQCSHIYENYGNIIWGRQSRYQNRNIFGKVITYDVSTYTEGKYIYVGNIFYKNGVAVITNESEYFKKMFTGSSNSGYSFNFKGTHTIYENEILCTVKPNEFNVSTNPTSVVYGEIDYDVNSDLKFDITDLAYIYRYIEGTFRDENLQLDYDEYTVRKESLETICKQYDIPYPSEIDIFDSKTENVGSYKDIVPVEKSFGFLEIRKYNSGTIGNKMRYNDQITAGDSVFLPNKIIYEVNSVQTLESISKMTGASVDSILSKNNIKDNSVLYVGQVLKIPNGGEVKNTLKLQEEQNTNWPNDDILLTESEDALIVDLVKSVLDDRVTTTDMIEIKEKIKTLHDNGLLDIDGDGEVTMRDAMLLVRYFIGRTGINLTKGLVDGFTVNATRTKPFDIINFLDTRTGKNRGVKILDEFVNYKENDAKDQTGSYLAPYVTTIGLYSGLELVMTAKLSRPVKIVPNYPINFLVKYDT
jgi:hypothetical protein